MIGSFSVTVNGSTPVQLKSSLFAVSWATIKALKDSGATEGGVVYIGGSSATTPLSNTNGFPLKSGEQIELEGLAGPTYIDLSTVYVVGDNGNTTDQIKVIWGRR